MERYEDGWTAEERTGNQTSRQARLHIQGKIVINKGAFIIYQGGDDDMIFP